MEKLNEKTLSKIYASYIGAKIELCQSRFTEDQQDRTFTLDGVCSDGFYVKELEGIKHEFGANDSLLLKHLSDISAEDKKRIESSHIGFLQRFDVFDSLVLLVMKSAVYEGEKRLNITFYDADYLRTEKYALPYDTYPIDKLVELGVYKILK